MRRRKRLLWLALAGALLVGASGAVAGPSEVRVAAEITLPEVFPGEYATFVWDSVGAADCDLDLPAGYTRVGLDRGTSGALQVGPIDADATVAVICDGVRKEVPIEVVPREHLGRDGVFDIGCLYSHTLADDPLQHYGDPGGSHVHDFFGNRTTDAYSTFDTLLDALIADPHATTCSEVQRNQDKPARNASGYWAPQLLRNGQVMIPDHFHLYYMSQTDRLARPFPPGFGMVVPMHEGHAKFWCTAPGKSSGDGLPNSCDGHRFFHLEVKFPSCWNGEIPPDGTGHVAYVKGFACPALYPFPIPRLLMEIEYRVDTPGNDPTPLSRHDVITFSSGDARTAHADELNAWDPFRLDFLVHECSNREARCKNIPPGDFTGPVHQVKA